MNKFIWIQVVNEDWESIGPSSVFIAGAVDIHWALKVILHPAVFSLLLKKQFLNFLPSYIRVIMAVRVTRPALEAFWNRVRKGNKKETKNTDLKRYIHPHVHCSIAYDRQYRKQPKCLVMNEWIKTVMYVSNEILFRQTRYYDLSYMWTINK